MENDREFGLFDVALLFVENLRLLVLVPLAVAAVAWGVATVVPPSYTSQAIMALPGAPSAPGAINAQGLFSSPVGFSMPTPQQAATIMGAFTAPAGVDGPARSNAGASSNFEEVSSPVQIKARVGKDNFVYLEVNARSPRQAQQMARLVIDSWLKSTVPTGQDRDDLQRQLAFAKSGLEFVQKSLQRANAGADTARASKSGEPSLGVIGEVNWRLAAEVVAIERALRGLTPDVIKQQPTLPVEPVSPKKRRIALFAWLAAAFFVVLVVLLRQAWRRGSADPQILERQARLRAALRFGGK